jgi:hypothetical protein
MTIGIFVILGSKGRASNTQEPSALSQFLSLSCIAITEDYL